MKFVLAIPVFFFACNVIAMENSDVPLQDLAIKTINQKLKHDVYELLKKNIRQFISGIIKDLSRDLKKKLSLQFLSSFAKAMADKPFGKGNFSDIDLMILSEFIRQIPDLAITTDTIKELYRHSYIISYESKIFFGIQNSNNMCLVCEYDENTEQIIVMLSGFDLYPVLLFANLDLFIDDYIYKYWPNGIPKDVVFDVVMPKASLYINILIDRLAHTDYCTNLIITSHDPSDVISIPSCISLLSNVKRLYFSEFSTIKLPKTIFKLNSMTSLFVDYIDTIKFSDTLHSAQNLKSLILKKRDEHSYDHGQEYGIRELLYLQPKLFQALPSLTHLHIEDDCENMYEILKNIATLPRLNRLFVKPKYRNQLPEELVERLESEEVIKHGYFALKQL